MNAITELNLPKEGKYLYAITGDAQERNYDVVGIDGQPVYSVAHGRVAAVVSNSSRNKIRPERAHLAAHKEVLARLMLDRTVLPMAFGIIANDLKAVKRMLALNQEVSLEQLERVAGKVEMGLRVVWDVPNIFEYFVDHHPDLREARDRLLGGKRELQQEEKLELGQFFEQVLTEAREARLSEIEETLAPCCEAIKRSPPRQIKEVANLSLLVDRARQKELDEVILDTAKQFDNNYAFDVNGPWAPHNFVDMDLQLDPPPASNTMLFIDKILFSPIYGLIWAARQVQNAMRQEQKAEPARITADLSELYMMLETGRITEAEFDAREKVLLDQLDRLQESEPPQEAPVKQKPRAKRVTGRKKATLKAAALPINLRGLPECQEPPKDLEEEGVPCTK